MLTLPHVLNVMLLFGKDDLAIFFQIICSAASSVDWYIAFFCQIKYVR